MESRTDRRGFLGVALAGSAATGAFLSHEDRTLAAALQKNGQTPSTGPATYQSPASAKPYSGDPLPTGKIGPLTISRLVLGGNLIGGWAHSRDLMYVSGLVRAYNTEPKVFETLALAEQSGINTIQVDPACVDFIEKYRRDHAGTIQMIVCFHPDRDDEKVRRQVDDLVSRGANALYTHGEFTDRLVMADDLRPLSRALEIARSAGVPAGLGSHSLQTPIASEKAGLGPDFYVKTFHPDSYWSATPEQNREEWCWYNGRRPEHDQYHDNIFDLHPDQTAEFFAGVKVPWIAFKVMAAGALNPQIGFTHAFSRGADFILAGMFDFQLALDVDIAVKAIRRAQKRERPWFG